MSQNNKKTNAEYFEEFFRKNYTVPKKIPTLDEIRLSAYRYKLLDAMWFDGHPPRSLHSVFRYWMNENYPDPWIHPDDIGGIMEFSEAELIYFCNRLKRPAWLHGAARYQFTVAQFQAGWGDFASSFGK